MFGKCFSRAYEGTMHGAGEHVFSVWWYAVIHSDPEGHVELYPTTLRDDIGMKIERVIEALEWLQRPDPESRNKEHGGRRLVKEGDFQYWMPSYRVYRAMRNAEDRKASNAAAAARYRERINRPQGRKRKPLTGEVPAIEKLRDGDISGFDRGSEPVMRPDGIVQWKPVAKEGE